MLKRQCEFLQLKIISNVCFFSVVSPHYPPSMGNFTIWTIFIWVVEFETHENTTVRVTLLIRFSLEFLLQCQQQIAIKQYLFLGNTNFTKSKKHRTWNAAKYTMTYEARGGEGRDLSFDEREWSSHDEIVGYDDIINTVYDTSSDTRAPFFFSILSIWNLQFRTNERPNIHWRTWNYNKI